MLQVMNEKKCNCWKLLGGPGLTGPSGCYGPVSIYQTIPPMICPFLSFSMHLQKAQKEKHWKNGSFLHLELCIIQDSTSTLRILNNIILITALFLKLFPIPSLFHITSSPLITILILRICPSFCVISVGSTKFSLLDNGLCSKRRFFQFASKCLYISCYLLV